MTFSSTFGDRDEIALKTTRMLLEIDAVRFDADRPFMFTSGIASPVYIDCRRIISYPRIRAALMDFAVATVLRDAGFQRFDAVAGGETAGIPFAAWIAAEMGLPMQYVRKRAKGFGRAAQVEGRLKDGERVLLVEDLTTDGGSKIRFCEALRRAGAEVGHALVLFQYDIFPQTRTRLAEHGLTLHSLATWRDVFTLCSEENRFDPAVLAEVDAFLSDPLRWSGNHGGASEIMI
ncbi:orotate phosphoribosyltransferase [Tranquillimonas rosea]|uniref:Orotate phosphoribosyltransferase n=1 Tax=Tranquillimonas rosea TaxID=641238 RepID=A0A1H9SH36_9RHOB|nr:orotate phosphoribosyltransferase [Tranquillimonas rosea]SER84284.1 orotate phosphoribosyltransferase [Tranquillimonas rosea]